MDQKIDFPQYSQPSSESYYCCLFLSSPPSPFSLPFPSLPSPLPSLYLSSPFSLDLYFLFPFIRFLLFYGSLVIVICCPFNLYITLYYLLAFPLLFFAPSLIFIYIFSLLHSF